MPHVTITVYVDIDDVVDELSSTEREQLARRLTGETEPTCKQLLERVYGTFRGRADTPECLRELLYQQLGRIL